MSDRLLAAYDYVLPEALIAQTPCVPRDGARLLVVKDQVQHGHAIVRTLPDLLREGDLLVLNNTRVIPARLYGHKLGGMPVEVLLLEPQAGGDRAAGTTHCWLALVKPGKRLKPGATIVFSGQDAKESTSDRVLSATVMAIDAATGGRILQFDVPAGTLLDEWINQLGQMPLPPYITQTEAHPDQYQTVYADRPGAVAAPTAGLHFTPELLQRLQAQGIEQAFVTLHVGVGTFRPVEAETITDHTMHAEWIEVPPETVAKIQQTKAKGGRIIAVGTTVVRSLESAVQSGMIQPFCGKSNLFIYPGYQWQVVDGLMTNFHLPKSSLMMLVSALIGRQRLLALYQIAIAEQYRFYSFGDAMLILPEAREERDERLKDEG
ncbi:tRNA preQ1(34) S-adenosylmethionine ribosyltransferase-isomerase QueA [Stenomitos frigidus]|uniref:S-adenosylmethionine:tRNA ribosyltransferase-isomerase n=1 Tax=Stenomitos frigidus ULC18 TaxID=2107698 RepID=A0A2T1DST2_9CYAN|nr:tRNA preQ1(34) S-adenosylmethionine ribosyltransferase-isomerase QueA [Stenomitos frigidus]PSB23569.1 tRNA preQ1(34) S-adenosylmethionine ribosyltransferase-isomerase QueA [Stenomitos frigidus ULC18]